MDNFKSYLRQIIVLSLISLSFYVTISSHKIKGIDEKTFICCVMSIPLSILISIFGLQDNNRFRSVTSKWVIFTVISILTWYGILALAKIFPYQIPSKLHIITSIFISVSILVSLLWTDFREHNKHKHKNKTE